jgi:hypothetical protein
MDVLISTLPTDIQNYILSLVIDLRKPKTISIDLMEEVSFHTGLLFNILKKTFILESIYMHVRYANVSLLAYYLVLILNDDQPTFKSNVTDSVMRLLFNDYETNINFETFLVYEHTQLTTLLFLIRKCWIAMCVNKRLKAYRLLI